MLVAQQIGQSAGRICYRQRTACLPAEESQAISGVGMEEDENVYRLATWYFFNLETCEA